MSTAALRTLVWTLLALLLWLGCVLLPVAILVAVAVRR